MQGVNTALYYKNKEMEDTFNIVPTSAIRFDLAFNVLLNADSLGSVTPPNDMFVVFFLTSNMLLLSVVKAFLICFYY
jgi:hypothetical protein